MNDKNQSIVSNTFSVNRFIFVVTLTNIVLYHLPLYSYTFANLNAYSINGVLTILTLITVIYMVSTLLLSIMGVVSPVLLKAFCIVFAIVNSVAFYFMDTYNVIYDRDMMGNIFNTRSEESLDFLHPKMFFYIAIFGLLPAWFISKQSIKLKSRLSIVRTSMLALLFGLLFIYLSSSTWLWFDKHSKQLGGAIVPWSYLINTVRSGIENNKSNKIVVPLPPATLIDDEPMLVVLVIGETARSHNFSLYGYERDTNPRLSGLSAKALDNARSCSTYTTASLRCMLTHTGESNDSFETLPSYLQRHNVDVIWRSNNWGEPDMTVSVYEKAATIRKSCTGQYCEVDDPLLLNLKERVASSKLNKQLVVLHMKGSHGPAYNTRYPAGFDHFKPVCDSVQLSECTEQSLINAYDNSILYTDDFLGRAIEMLTSYEDRPVLFMYVSDHGESLGEFGLYLHGTPYTIAPDVQKDIPFIVWMSDQFETLKELKTADIELTTKEHAHNQVFHSVVGAFGLQTEVYKAEMDLFNSTNYK